MKTLIMLLAIVVLFQTAGMVALAADGCCANDACKCEQGVCSDCKCS